MCINAPRYDYKINVLNHMYIHPFDKYKDRIKLQLEQNRKTYFIIYVYEYLHIHEDP